MRFVQQLLARCTVHRRRGLLVGLLPGQREDRGEQLDQLLGVDTIVGGEAGGPHVPQTHHAVVGAAEEPGGLGAVEDETVDRGVLLVQWLPLVKTNLRRGGKLRLRF